MNDSKHKKIAIVGGGVAGLTAAYLLNKKNHVTLYEKNSYIGGHTNTITIDKGEDQGLCVDTGFIVYNDRNYPNFIKLLNQLEIEGQDSDMSFGFSNGKLEYSSYFPAGVFAQKRNLVNPAFIRMVGDILKFNKNAVIDLNNNRLKDISLGRYLNQLKMGQMFREFYLIPMGAAIWSTSLSKMLDFPAHHFAQFFFNHGLLALKGRPQWKTIPGGSKNYVQKILSKMMNQYHVNASVTNIKRKNNQIIIQSQNQDEEVYDAVVIATHADQALKLLEDPTDTEHELLSAWTYSNNKAVLHTDVSLLPKRHNARASWNYTYDISSDHCDPVSVTYDMNRLQKLKTKNQYLVTLNSKKEISADQVVREIEYTHPIYDYKSMSTQKHLSSLNGIRGTFFCGSYFHNGFHEDAVKSAVAVAEYFGESL